MYDNLVTFDTGEHSKTRIKSVRPNGLTDATASWAANAVKNSNKSNIA